MTAMFPVVILAGGLATRLRPLTEKIPKSLVDVNGEPFIAHQLHLLRASDITRVVVCAAHLGEMIRDAIGDGAAFGMRVEYSFDGPKLLGTAGAIKRALNLLDKNFFVLYGDSYLPCNYRHVQTAFESTGKPALMTVFLNNGQWDRSNVAFADGRIWVYDKRSQLPQMRYIDYGLGVFKSSAFDAIPNDTPYDLAALYQDLLARGDLAGYEVNERFYEIGSFEGLEETRRYLKLNGTRTSADERG